ncbi:bifunctional glycosyltransferase 87/phosphatase PAP2 family protein [Streptomyces pathocidini]|uniref:Bifunctional glycosyltransferase 87/phosphatase PAP2 family protein n=2 Tax=Streptomyces pathocidini TaxID=1650571 RepID=A0ABW7UX16_9ACTN
MTGSQAAAGTPGGGPGAQTTGMDGRPRVRTALALLWLLVGLLAARQATAVLRLPPGERLTDLETWIGPSGVLRAPGPLYENGTFTGTPFAGLALKPLTRAAEQGLGVFWTFGTLLLVVALGFVAARALPRPVSRRTALFAAPVAIGLMVLSLPVRNTFTLGQTSILPVLLVLVAMGHWPRTSHRLSGVLIGLAAALQPTVLLFVPLLWMTGRRQAAGTTAATFAGCSALAWAVSPGDSATYWLSHVAGAGLGEAPDSLHNQSLHGLLLRLGLSGPLELALYAVLAVTVAVIGLRRAARYAADGQLLLAAALTGCVAVAVSPTAWLHQQLWILLAVVGRVGRRRADRLAWPVLVVMVMSLSAAAVAPTSKGLHLIGQNAPLLVAIAAACCVPFLDRRSPHWARPVPTPYADRVPAYGEGGRRRLVPLLRFVRRPLSRPNLLLELLLIRAGYFAYSYIRGSAPETRSTAEEHGRQILGIESALGIDVEHGFNHLVAGSWLEGGMNYYYSTFHFLVPLSLLGWMYLRRPVAYRWARTALAIATVLALVGFWLYPLAPPRLMPGLGYIDTANGSQNLSHPEFGPMTDLANQYAAMPSLHVGWSLWCAIVIVLLAPKPWLKFLGALYPVLTLAVIVGTANHYLLDAVGGAVVVAAGFGLQYVLWGRSKETGLQDVAPGRVLGAGSRRGPEAAREQVPEETAPGPHAASLTKVREWTR